MHMPNDSKDIYDNLNDDREPDQASLKHSVQLHISHLSDDINTTSLPGICTNFQNEMLVVWKQ